MLILFIAGVLLSLTGSLPPGLISLSVAQTSIARGMRPALWLAAGASAAEFFQAWFAVEMSGWFMRHPAVERYFQWASVPVFWAMAVYLFFFARAPKSAKASQSGSVAGQIGKGALLSAFNLLAIPYWFTYCGWLRVTGWWRGEGIGYDLIFSAGVSIGTFCALVLYARLGQEIVKRSDKMAQYANRFVGLIFFALGLKVVIDIF